MRPVRCRRTGGYTLVELIVALALLAMLVSASAPTFAGHVSRIRMQGVLDGLTRDIFHARMAAVRAGRTVEIRFSQREDEPCVASYAVVVVAEPEQVAKQVNVMERAHGHCLRKNGPAVVTFSSRGRPNWNYSFWMRSGAIVDSMTLNQLGRVYRW